MSTQHACVKCGSTVFTLEAPRSTVGNARINTGIKLATCMQCGCQDRPKDIEVDTRGRMRHEKYKREYHASLIGEPEHLRTMWLQKFNQYAKGITDEDNHRRDWEQQRNDDWRAYQLGRY